MIDVTDADDLVRRELCDAGLEYKSNTLFHRVQANYFIKSNPGVKKNYKGNIPGFFDVTGLIWKLVDVKNQKRWATVAKEVEVMPHEIGEYL